MQLPTKSDILIKPGTKSVEDTNPGYYHTIRSLYSTALFPLQKQKNLSDH